MSDLLFCLLSFFSFFRQCLGGGVLVIAFFFFDFLRIFRRYVFVIFNFFGFCCGLRIDQEFDLCELWKTQARFP